MRILMIVVMLAAVGGGAGLIQSWMADFHPEREHFIRIAKVRRAAANEMNKAAVKTPAKGEKKEGPRVTVLNGETYDFGKMERGVTRSHTFLVKNTGTKPLELVLQRTTCKCTLSKVGKNLVAPGEVTEITLEWSTKDVDKNEMSFSQLAEVETNDPDRPIIELRVRGEITSKYRIFPSRIELRELVGTQENRVRLRVMHFGDGNPEIVGWKFEPEKYQNLIDITSEPLPDEDVKKVKGATGGLLTTVLIKPGLPVGPLTGKLLLEIESGGQRKTEELNVHLNIVGDIVLTGSSNFDRFRTLLNMRGVTSKEGARARLYAFVKGPHRESTKLSVASVDPSNALQVSIGEPMKLASGRSIRYTITLTVPKGAPRTDRTGKGTKLAKVVLKTTHPTTKEINIYVSLSVH